MVTSSKYNGEVIRAWMNVVPFHHDTDGSGSDIHTLTMERNFGSKEVRENWMHKSCNDLSFLKEVVHFIRYYIDNASFPDHIGSPYDCTGQAFGSRWERISTAIDNESVSVAFTHSYAIDV